jgi:hypothetical protein
MITAIIILSGLALFQLFLNVVLYKSFRIAWNALKEQTEEIVPIDTDSWDEIKNRKDK